MISFRLAIVAVVTGILVMSSGALAHAATDPYPVRTPAPTPSIAPDDDAIAPDDDNAVAPDDRGNGILPETGGVGFYLLLVGGGLVVAGAGAVHVSRRRHATSR